MLQTFVFEYYLIIVRDIKMTYTHIENKNFCSAVTYSDSIQMFHNHNKIIHI